MANAASPDPLPESVSTILVTRLDGLGDIVLGTMLLSGLRRRWPGATVNLLVRQQMAGVGAILPEWVRVIPLPFDPRQPVAGRGQEIIEKLKAFAPECRADVAVVAEYNRTWAGEIAAALSGAARVLAFDGPTGINLAHREIIAEVLGGAPQENWWPVGAASQEREPAKYAKFLDALGVGDETTVPQIAIRDHDRQRARATWHDAGAVPEETIVCFPGSGEQLVRSLDPQIWAKWIAHLSAKRPVVLLGGTADGPVLDEIADCGLPTTVRRVLIPNDDTGLLAAVLERAGAYVGMDTGPMHVAAVLGRPTLGVFGGGHCAERFLPVGRRAMAVRMPLGCYGCEWHCPFETRLCIKNIPMAGLIEAGDRFLDAPENADAFSPRVIDMSAPAELPAAILGPVMRQHRRFLTLNHSLGEHHAYLAGAMARQQEQIAQLSRGISDLARQNHERGEAIVVAHQALARMTEHNQHRDAAIARLGEMLAEMTKQNSSRDHAIAHISATLAEMTRQNGGRDGAIQHVNDTLAEMTRQNAGRDEAIASASKRWWK